MSNSEELDPIEESRPVGPLVLPKELQKQHAELNQKALTSNNFTAAIEERGFISLGGTQSNKKKLMEQK